MTKATFKMAGEMRFVDSRLYHISLSTQTVYGLFAWSVRNKTNLEQNRVTFCRTFTLAESFERGNVMYLGQLCDMFNSGALLCLRKESNLRHVEG
jgi:hypothetical protein